MKFHIFGALLLLCLSKGIESAGKDRILGGDEALTDDIPYAASLRIDNMHVCGACILSETKLLSAAHCFYRNDQLIDTHRVSVRVGSTNQYAGGKIVTIASYKQHPDYYKLHNNLAIITLSAPLQWTDRVKAIPLMEENDELPADGATVTVSGWGTTTDGNTSFKIRQLQLKYAANAICTDAYSEHDPKSSFCLTHPLKEGTCYGDGGGPAVYNGKLMGICNFVVGACGSRYPDVFLRTAAYNSWLKEQLA